MTGRSGRTSSWLPDLTVPILLAAAEAGWFSLLVAGRVRVHDRIAMDVPYLGVALPAIAAAAGVAWARRFSGRGALVARWVAGVVGAALTAGILSELTVPGSFVVVATHPWSSPGHAEATVAWVAWWVAIVAWARGAWLGSGPVSTRHAGFSLTAAGAAYLGIFIGHASDGHGPFAAATSDAGLLFFVSFLLGGAAFAFARQHDIESDAVPGARSRPSLAWGSALAVPMAVLGLLGLGVAFVGGPAAQALGDGMRLGADGLARLVAFLFSWIPDIHLKGKLPTQRGAGLPVGRRPPLRPTPVSGTAKVIALVLLVILAIAVVVGIVLLIKRLWPQRRSKPELDDADDEQDSVFSWEHFFAQLRAGLRRLLPRRRPGRDAVNGDRATVPASGELDMPPPPDSVREAYRRVLIEARTLGSPRRRAETTIELEGRLQATVGDPAAVSLRRLTAVYDDVRYGGRETDVAANRAARQDVDEVLPALQAGLAPPDPEPQVQDHPGRGRGLAPLPERRRWWRRRRS